MLRPVVIFTCGKAAGPPEVTPSWSASVSQMRNSASKKKVSSSHPQMGLVALFWPAGLELAFSCPKFKKSPSRQAAAPSGANGGINSATTSHDFVGQGHGLRTNEVGESV